MRPTKIVTPHEEAKHWRAHATQNTEYMSILLKDYITHNNLLSNTRSLEDRCALAHFFISRSYDDSGYAYSHGKDPHHQSFHSDRPHSTHHEKHHHDHYEMKHHRDKCRKDTKRTHSTDTDEGDPQKRYKYYSKHDLVREQRELKHSLKECDRSHSASSKDEYTSTSTKMDKKSHSQKSDEYAVSEALIDNDKFLDYYEKVCDHFLLVCLRFVLRMLQLEMLLNLEYLCLDTLNEN